MRIFNDRRLLRIETYGVARQEQVLPIASATFNGGNSPSVTLTDNVQGIGGFGSGNEVTLVGYVRYRLKRDVRRNAASLKYDLVREELDSAGNAIDGTALIIAENMVDLQVYDICLNTNTPEAGTMRQVPIVNGNTLRCFDTLEALESAGFSLRGNNSNDSHMLRALTVKLSARTPFEDPDISFAPRLERDTPLRTFELEPNLRGAARVFELAAMVTLTSVQARRQ